MQSPDHAPRRQQRESRHTSAAMPVRAAARRAIAAETCQTSQIKIRCRKGYFWSMLCTLNAKNMCTHLQSFFIGPSVGITRRPLYLDLQGYWMQLFFAE
mmetsp:Transcript_26672/g.70014  ORF Transcript_26672/g.70014 Transcript_26672/m.70014 type:complete len:99 (-) Transcript_26672:1276-1572(-)